MSLTVPKPKTRKWFSCSKAENLTHEWQFNQMRSIIAQGGEWAQLRCRGAIMNFNFILIAPATFR